MPKTTSGRKSKSTENSEHWGQRLSNVLKEHEMSHRAAAKLIEVAPSVIDAWVKGAAPSDLIAVKKLSDHLNTSFAWLVTGQREKDVTRASMTELFKEQEFFDGIVKIKMSRLVPRNDPSDKD